jgi:hypothetical protein
VNSIDGQNPDQIQVAFSEGEIAAARTHATEISEGKAFKGSDRCGRFLKYIVDQTLSGHSDSLKERVIGVELFGRSPSYDTSEDAIVRVTASDVRKRLTRHYGRNGNSSPIRISLPIGSYVPEISIDSAEPTNHFGYHDPRRESSSSLLIKRATEPLAVSPRPDHSNPGAVLPEFPVRETALSKWRGVAFLLAAMVVVLALLNLVLGYALKERPRVKPVQNPAYPWSALFSSTRPTHIVTSDIDIVKIQRLLGRRISVSDYANRAYLSDLNALSPELKKMGLTMMSGDKAPLIDTRIVASIAELAKDSPGRIDVVGARSLQFQDLKSDDNFIFLGSPYSDPWLMVFNDQLDFRLQSHSETDLGPEFISDVHPGPNEQPVYAASAIGGATGETWAVLALLGNPNQYGHVLLLAGISGEGTQAAGELATDLPSLSAALAKCGVSLTDPPKHFEMLLHIKIMAGYPSQYDVAGCHILPSAPLH